MAKRLRSSKLTKAQARKRLEEAQRKINAVFMADINQLGVGAGRKPYITFDDWSKTIKMLQKAHQKLK